MRTKVLRSVQDGAGSDGGAGVQITDVAVHKAHTTGRHGTADLRATEALRFQTDETGC